ncbi:MAG: CBS domain-containing protein, partial [Nanoarchaeota archaeon]
LPSKTLVDDIMESNLIVVREEQNIEEAITLMRDHNVRHLPVMNKKEQFVGFITGKDILKIQPELFKLLAEKMRK